MKKKIFQLLAGCGLMAVAGCVHQDHQSVKRSASLRPNILLIVADDLNYDSPGFAGGVAPDVTPNLDRLAQEGLSFKLGFTPVSVCQPARQSMLTGVYPHNYGSGGFFPMAEGVPTLPATLAENGYLTANIHKVHHMQPMESFGWTFTNQELGLTDPDGVVGRDPAAFAAGLRRLIDEADQQNKSFFMVANSADTHRPFHGDTIPWSEGYFWGENPVDIPEPSRIYAQEEVRVPPPLPDLPGIREDLAKYASSLRRLDDTVGACLNVLKETGREHSTLVIFVSDNGMPLPYAKFDCFLGSNRIPFVMRWPEVIRPGIDAEHMVSLIDLTPTILELAGLPSFSKTDGYSLVQLMKGEAPDEWRRGIVSLRNEDINYGVFVRLMLRKQPDFLEYLDQAGFVERPDHKEAGTYTRSKQTRCYFDGRFGYIYNDWYDPDGLKKSRYGAGVPGGDPSMLVMKAAAKTNAAVKARYESFLLRSLEEFYDWDRDPGTYHNLIDHPEVQKQVMAARQGLLEWMNVSGDPLLPDYLKRLGEDGVRLENEAMEVKSK
ncbi:sulfatase family protein [Pontiella sulfatireligans]|uniref:Choline-sulfatase n=1 Tax=Pontiella sulfatireligans TaxID=2750658 RepID=A0A6C2UHZ5_9BACT|nr:sulfatase [Pontiella sulfatireligans]SPS74361.1 sulfatase S1_8 [Kiritimatiellales bacterium]VGO19579.1 Choline-sulfatase [Pontiella sulfatireligans]